MKDEPQIPDALNALAEKAKSGQKVTREELSQAVGKGGIQSDSNQTPWRTNTWEDPFWKSKGRVEVQYRSGKTETLVCPSCCRKLHDQVTFWRSVSITTRPKLVTRPIAPAPVSQEKVLPTVFRHVVKTEWFRQFSWKERLAVLFGANIVVMIGLATQNNPGAFQPLIMGKISKHNTPDNHMREAVENMLAAKESAVHKLIPPPTP